MTLAEDILDALVDDLRARAKPTSRQWDLEALEARGRHGSSASRPRATRFQRSTPSDEIRDALWERRPRRRTRRRKSWSAREVLQRVERDIMLQIVDAQWKDHLYSLDHLKEGIGLRGYGQRDPLVEYKSESFAALPGDEGARRRGDRPLPLVAAAGPQRRKQPAVPRAGRAPAPGDAAHLEQPASEPAVGLCAAAIGRQRGVGDGPAADHGSRHASAATMPR